jgi:hypothetical protein
MNRPMNHLGRMVDQMPKLSPREAVKRYQVSRATLMKSIENGTISAEQNERGHWSIDAAELMRVYVPRASYAAVDRTRPDQVNRDEPDQKTDDATVRVAVLEAELAAERAKVDLLQRHLDDVRRMLPPPDAKQRRKWWPW